MEITGSFISIRNIYDFHLEIFDGSYFQIGMGSLIHQKIDLVFLCLILLYPDETKSVLKGFSSWYVVISDCSPDF